MDFSLGLVEVSALGNAIMMLDEMLKVADVEFTSVERKLGGRLVTIVVRGSISSVTASVEAGKRFAQNAGFNQTFSVSERALNILFQKFLVEIQTEAEIYHALSHAAIKATVPHHFFAVFLGHVKSSFLHKDKKSEFSRWDWAGERERLMVLNGKKNRPLLWFLRKADSLMGVSSKLYRAMLA